MFEVCPLGERLFSFSSCPVLQHISAHSRDTITHVVNFPTLSHFYSYLLTLEDVSLPLSLIVSFLELVILVSSSVVKDTMHTFWKMFPDCYNEMWHLSSKFPWKNHVCVDFGNWPLPCFWTLSLTHLMFWTIISLILFRYKMRLHVLRAKFMLAFILSF